jgi:hypothetical protein
MNIRKQKKIAAGLLAIWLYNIFFTTACYALTSGPSQPEFSSFSPAGESDMVDLFTGDFKYNIPLMDVDGYPVNLNYHSGAGIDDEASWVGLGWNLNVGAVERQVRGIPDDMAGDAIKTEHYTKPKVTVGGRLTLKTEVFGKGKNLLGKVGVGGSFSLGVFNDNYTGIGADVSANAGISYGRQTDGPLTASLGLGILSSTSSGVDVTPYVDLGIKESVDKKVLNSAGLSASLGYNSRSGLKGLTLGASYKISKQAQGNNGRTYSGTGSTSGSLISFNTEPVTPDIQIPYRSRFGSFSIDAGGVIQSVFLGGGGTGYKSVTEVASPALSNPGYGFMYAERGKNQKNAVMDFIREKDNPIIPELPNLAVPVHTPDLFTYNSQGASGQFRLYRGGSGAFFDNEVTNDDGITTLGGDLGFGVNFHVGVTLFQQTTKNTTRKWVNDNNYLAKGDFQDAAPNNPNVENVYFKVVGEKTAEDADMAGKLQGNNPLAVSISGKTANGAFTGYGMPDLKKTTRERKGNIISYLTAEEASKAALDKVIYQYNFNDFGNFQLPVGNKPVPFSTLSRVDNVVRQKHHISEITVTDMAGKRMVYGIPVYNIRQDEYSFAIGARGKDYGLVPGTLNQVPLDLEGSGSINHQKGIDHYYNKETQPAYAASYLITGILSADYVDRTNNGITDDDAGTALKFNYSKLSNPFKWRTPYQNSALNRGLLADPDDDKANIIYGEKEIWYVNTIESKTKVAYFITQDRKDALGVTDFTGAHSDLNNRQKCLKEIRLYSKADMSRPIKVVKFDYTYELCRGVPNSADNQNGLTTDPLNGGKLTLKRVYFLYGNSSKGAAHPYVFNYNKQVNGQEVLYGSMKTDRWGTYKSPGDNTLPLRNDEFPYTQQDISGQSTAKTTVDQNAAVWQLNSIKLPSSGEIGISYESDDYAFVQNKKATVMSGIAGLIDQNGNDLDSNSVSYLRDAKGIRLSLSTLPPGSGDRTQWFKNAYLNGSDYIYSKVLTKMSTPYSKSTPETDDDFVSCYSPVKSVTVEGSFAKIILEDRTDGGITANPIIFSAWQLLKNEYPRFAYPGFDRRLGNESAQSSVAKAVTAIFSAFSNLSELTENFYQKAFQKNFAAKAHLNRSFVKIVKQDGVKLGGGLRVKKIKLSDEWQAMTGSNNSTTASYGQAYTYTTTENGSTISSGVAAYEPAIGADENPLKEPVDYIQKIKGAIDNFFSLEKPFGESFFPAPVVGYSKVTVTDLDKNGDPDPGLRTGFSVTEFYTAREFPVFLQEVHVTPKHNKPSNYLSFLGATSIDEMCMSQGYSVDLNDMHGKLKATRTFNSSKAEIASTVYYYNAASQGAGEMKLKNRVRLIQPDGGLALDQVVGRDVEFFTDFRESESKNQGRSVNLGYDMIGLGWFSFPLPHFPIYDNSEYKLFRSVVAVKVSTYYGIIDKVVKTQNGSSITTENVAFDGVTGQPVVTRTQNEFNKYIYATHLPAYWVYKRMGAAYQNLGVVLKEFSTNSFGEPISYASVLNAGDVLMDLVTGRRYWIIENAANPATRPLSKKMINDRGQLVSYFNAQGLMKLVRSGLRNMLDPETETLVTLKNPLINYRLGITSHADLTNLGVLDAAVTTFNENWPMETTNNPSDSIRVENTSAVFTYTAATSNPAHGIDGAYIFAPEGNSTIQNIYLKAGLDRSGIWLNPPNTQYLDELIGFEKQFYISADGDYILGYAGDDDYQFKIDGFILPSSVSSGLWNVKPRFLNKGYHTLTAQCINYRFQSGSDNPSTNPGSMGFEVYRNTLSEMIAAPPNGDGINVVFSTRSLVNDPDMQSFRTLNGNKVYRFTYRRFMNPYLSGHLGNWRAREKKVYQQTRYTSDSPLKGQDVKSAGYLNSFSSYWYYGDPAKGQTLNWQTDNSQVRRPWITANTVTSYDRYGQELENRDALGRYSAAQFDFNGELPSAVASNALNREIYVGSFEDTKFAAATSAQDSPTSGGFTEAVSHHSLTSLVNSDFAHSGNYSILLPVAGIEMNTLVYNASLGIDTLLSVNEYGEYNTKKIPGLYPNGFEPAPGKSYLFNAWIKDSHPTDRSVSISLQANGVTVPLTCKAVVEDWKLVEGTLSTPALSGDNSLILLVKPTDAAVYIDDIRVHPFDTHIKSYVYDDKTMRLMAEIDENGFGTFYEYDDEGLLVRIKKETERGVMTIKEARSSYKKQNI